MHDKITIKLPATSHRLLRLLAATTGEQQYKLIVRLVADEARRHGVEMQKPQVAVGETHNSKINPAKQKRTQHL